MNAEDYKHAVERKDQVIKELKEKNSILLNSLIKKEEEMANLQNKIKILSNK